ncbi:MAG: chorismate-binding protein [Burkholderiaceae bacterium]|nr:chorismate-binding protein [Burkholderiaceae bacterium]
MTAQIDFSDPRDPAAPRLRHAWSVPRQVLRAQRLDEVRPLLDAVQACAEQGAWCVGWVRYEAAPTFDPAFQTLPADGPLAWFAVYDAPQAEAAQAPPARAAEPVLDWQAGLDRASFDAAVERIQQAIAAGEIYQVNYTAPLTAPWSGEGAQAQALFEALQRAQPGGYAVCLDSGQAEAAVGVADPQAQPECLLSVSPELFFDWRGGEILARPMKGTAPRGATPAEDAEQAATLRASPKERAENVMIVDLLRNDLSRLAEPHSVQVPALFQTQALPSVWQMTSDVTARTRPDTRLSDVFAALFPCGSVTGAPKVRAMQLIAALESAPRGVYCGAVGVVRPWMGKEGPPHGVHATFNVPIRTVVLRGEEARCGIGSGITSGAQAGAEWDEWRHKRAFLERASQPFDLLETLALDGGQWRHLAEHLARMAASAAHFGYPWDAERALACLQALAARHPQGVWRVRWLWTAAGQPQAEAFALQPPPATPVRLQLADRPFEAAHSEFVRHKTTRRAHYAAFAPTAPGVFDTLLWNAAGEITESTFGNIAARLDGRWVTPPLACGLLPGVGRAVALREGRVVEAVLRVQDLPRVQDWAFLNSLRGWLPAVLG